MALSSEQSQDILRAEGACARGLTNDDRIPPSPDLPAARLNVMLLVHQVPLDRRVQHVAIPL